MVKNLYKFLFAIIICVKFLSVDCVEAAEYDQELTIPVNNYFSVEVPMAAYEFDHNFAELVTIDGENKLLLKNTGDTVVKVLYPVNFNPPKVVRLYFLMHIVPQESFVPGDWEKQEKANEEPTENEITNYYVRVLELVNIERAKVGARPLRITDDLQRAADIRAKELTILFSHDRPDGSKCFTVLGRKRNGGLGENIAAGAETPEDVVDGWMNSPGHRRNILDKNFKELGVGYCYDENGVGGYVHYWVQIFRG